MNTVTDGIERASREISRRLDLGGQQASPTPLSWLEVQIVFWSERLENERRSHKEHLRQILRAECEVGTDLLQLTDSYHGLRPDDAERHDRLKEKVRDLGRERRKATIAHERDAAQIHEKLLHLLGQHAHLRKPLSHPGGPGYTRHRS
jgi:hypothetical protein